MACKDAGNVVSSCAGDNEQAEKIMGGCFTCLVGTALVLTALFWAFGEPLLWLFGCSEDPVRRNCS